MPVFLYNNSSGSKNGEDVMATKKIHEQWTKNLYNFFLRTVLVIFCCIGTVQVYLHGTGTRSSYTSRGIRGRIVSYLRMLEDTGHEDLVKWILIGIFAFAAIYTLVLDIHALLHITPGLTKLGRSIRRQAAPHESFRDLCAQIDADMEGGCKELGSGVFISSSWLLEDEAMRLTRIRKITRRHGFGKNGLVLSDVDGNRMNLDLVFDVLVKDALAGLQKQLPLVEIEDLQEGGTMMNTTKQMSWHVPKTPEEIEDYRQQAAQGDSYAQTEYGKCLLFGKGGLSDSAAAFGWFEKAAGQDDEIAKMYLGHCIMYGIGAEADEFKGYELLNNALEYNYPEDSSSQPLADYSEFEEEDLYQLFWDLGDAFENSRGVLRNYRVAVYYFEMLADFGCPEGADRMRHYKKGFLGKWKKTD